MWKTNDEHVWNRDAALNWAPEYGDTFWAAGYEQGEANPCLLHLSELDVSVMVHGDDFVVLGPDNHLDNIKNSLREIQDQVRTAGVGQWEECRNQDSQQSCTHDQRRH